MLKKLLRLVFTLVGGIIGYGAFLLTKYLLTISDIGPGRGFTQWQQIGAAVVFVIIFALLFFRLTPSVKRQSQKMAKNIESDLQSYSTNELIAGIAGLITGLLIAFLISQIYAGIEVDYLPTVLTVLTYLLLGYLGVVVATKKRKRRPCSIDVRQKSNGFCGEKQETI